MHENIQRKFGRLHTYKLQWKVIIYTGEARDNFFNIVMLTVLF